METDVKLKVVVVGQPGQPCLKEHLDRDSHDRPQPDDQHVAVGRPQDPPPPYCKGRAQDGGLRLASRAPALRLSSLLRTYAVPSPWDPSPSGRTPGGEG